MPFIIIVSTSFFFKYLVDNNELISIRNLGLSILNNTVSNLKRYWCPHSKDMNWYDNNEHFLDEFLYHSTQIKNIWIPYGE